MISANDVLQIISETHQYSILLFELRNATTLGISHAGNGKVSYFRLEGRLGRVDRRNLVQNISGGETPCKLHFLSVDQFLQEIEGKKIRHIWLETLDKQRKELAFASIAELKAHFQSQSRK